MDASSTARLIDGVRADEAGETPPLWAYIDLDDAARACLLALTSPYEGHLPLYITAAATTSDWPTDDLLTRHYPTVARRIPPDRPIASYRRLAPARRPGRRRGLRSPSRARMAGYGRLGRGRRVE